MSKVHCFQPTQSRWLCVGFYCFGDVLNFFTKSIFKIIVFNINPESYRD